MTEGVSQGEPHELEPQHVVVVNHEEQYSVWPADRPAPAGWSAVGEPAGKEACLEHVARVWTDMRPLSLRRRAQVE